jgi:phage portal protein BeeE
MPETRQAGLLTRIGNAFHALAGHKTLSPDLQAWATGGDVVDTAAGAELDMPYAQSSWIYIAVGCLAENVAQIPLRISRVPESATKELRRGAAATFKRRVLGENIIEAGAAVDLFAQPHPTMDRALFLQSVVSWKALRGEFFVLPLDANDQAVDLAARGGRVARLLTLEPGMFWHIVQGYDLMGWRYTGSALLTPLPSMVLLPGEVIHQRSYNPYLYWRGMSPLLLAMLAAMSDYAGAMFMKGLMLNNADTGIIATTEQNLTQEQREQFTAALRERKRKAGTPDRPLFLSSGVKIEKPTISNVDMEFLQNRKYAREEIFGVFKVPPSLAGVDVGSSATSGGGINNNSGGGKNADRLSFVQNTLTNLCREIEAAFRPIVKKFDPSYEVWFDIESLPVMQEARRDRLDAATKAFGLGVPLNDLNQVYDLGFREYSWGKTGYLPFSLTPAGEPQPEPAEEKPDEQNEEKGNPFERLAELLPRLGHTEGTEDTERKSNSHFCGAPNGYEQSIAGSEKAKAGRMKKFFFEQRNRVLARLPAALKDYSGPWSDRPNEKTIKSVNDLWDADDENQKLHQKLDPALRLDLEFGGAQLFSEIGAGIDFNLPPSEAMAFLAKRANVISGINDTTWDETKASLLEGLAQGDSTADLAQRVKDVFGASDSRAWTIATTETNVAVNSGRHLGMKQAGVKRKGWLTAHLEHTRVTHLANESLSKNQNGIGIDDVWPNGCSYPGDPGGAPGETINCHCVGFALGDSKAAPAKFLGWEEFLTKRIQ